MAGPQKKRGFTLVELLVVITIIGMLVSLLLPAIQSAREAGRKNTCQNNMRNCGLALGNFESAKKGFPGYANLMGAGTSNPRRASWVVPILPYLERNDIYQVWQNPNSLWGTQTFYTQMAVLVCPSNPAPTTGSNPLSFVVNTGIAISASDNLPSPLPSTNASSATVTGSSTSVTSPWPADLNSGVFFNQSNWDVTGASPPSQHTGKKSTMDFISTNDGTSYTLMLSENLQATNWATEATDTSSFFPQYQSDFSLRQNTGFAWYYLAGNPNNIGPPPTSASGYNPQSVVINGLAKVVTGTPTLSFNSAGTNASGLAFARPSSNHPGGVNAFFCGGNARFIAEDIGYNVYTQLMTAYQNGVILSQATAMTPAVTPITLMPPWNYTLNEADF